MTVARVRAIWSGPLINGGGISDFYFFASSGDEQLMTDAVDDLVADMANLVGTGNAVRVDSSVANFNEGSGDLISLVPITQPVSHSGSDSGDPLPPATQGLIQWLTPGVVNNRRVRGRTFWPALTEGSNTGGVPNGLITGSAVTMLATYIAGPGGVIPVIWSRPAPGRPGTIHNVEAAGLWNKWAVLRSRRD